MNRKSDLALGGWSISTVSLWETGPYLTPITSSSFDPGNLNLSYRGGFQRPDCSGNANSANTATGSTFNIAAFNSIPKRPVGNCGVGILEGPGTATIAAGLSKTFHLTERMRFESTVYKFVQSSELCAATNERNVFVLWHCPERPSAENSGNRTGQVSLRLDF